MLAVVLASLSLCGWLYLTLFHGRFWQPLVFQPARAPETWPAVDVIIPARNKADMLPDSLPSLLAQDYPGPWRVILVDDGSTDGTADVVRQIAAEHPEAPLHMIEVTEKPPGWSGKVAAMQAGLEHSDTAYVLFTDADIYHPHDALQRLVARAETHNLDLVSLMVRLRCQGVAEKLLIPAFVFFFAMLYPFRRANNPRARTAAAAGGVMLVRRQALDDAGGLARIRDELIDDCALAYALKYPDRGRAPSGRIELTLAENTYSLRPHPEPDDVWQMIARVAYTQLNYSPPMLAGTIAGMALLFGAPVFFLLTGPATAAEIGVLAWILMTAIYAPMVTFYRLPVVWALTLPAAALIYIGATIDSARLYWQGRSGQWKGRTQA